MSEFDAPFTKKLNYDKSEINSVEKLFRIQKLILNEYKAFNDDILVESPFAQVTESGLGIREVQIALTKSSLLIAMDIFDKQASECLQNVFSYGVDEATESLELLSALPLSFIFIKIFIKDSRHIMRVDVGSSKVMFFEFGSHILRNIYTTLWNNYVNKMKLKPWHTNCVNKSSSENASDVKVEICEKNGWDDMLKFKTSLIKERVSDNKKKTSSRLAAGNNKFWTLKNTNKFLEETPSAMLQQMEVLSDSWNGYRNVNYSDYSSVSNISYYFCD